MKGKGEKPVGFEIWERPRWPTLDCFMSSPPEITTFHISRDRVGEEAETWSVSQNVYDRSTSFTESPEFAVVNSIFQEISREPIPDEVEKHTLVRHF